MARTGRWGLITGLLCALLAASIVSVLVPNFKEAFASYGVGLPLLTRLVFSCHWAIWLLPVAVVAARWRWPAAPRRDFMAGLIGVLGSLALTPLAVVAMYLPIFQLAATG